MKIPINLNDRPLSSSSLKEFRKSPKHYVQYITEPRKPPTESQLVGSAFELFLIDSKRYESDVFVYTKPNMRTNAGKDEMEQLSVAGAGKIMITTEMEQRVKLMNESARACPEIMRYVDAITATQIKLTWTDRATGIPFIGYVDGEGEIGGEPWAFEIKTAASADPDQFQRDFWKWDYNTQIPTYAEGYHKSRFKFPNFAILVFETEPPYNCAPIMIDNKLMEFMKDEWRATVTAFKYCMDNELFHQGYEFRLQTIDYFRIERPGYYKPKFVMPDELETPTKSK